MTFRDDNGNTLEFNDAFALTKQAVSFFEFDILGDVSINFAIDANSQNKKTLGYFGPQMINQVAWVKQPFNRMNNGNVVDRGYIVIQSEEDGFLNCFYTSGNSNWIQLLNGLITELDYTGLLSNINYTTQITQANILTNPTSGIVFPMIDWNYNFNKGSNWWAAANIFDKAGLKESSFMEFYPCFYLSSIVREIAVQNNIKITGNLLSDPLFNSIAITPSGELKRQHINGTSASGGSLTSTTSSKTYNLFTALNDPEGLISNYRYIANKSALVQFTFRFVSSAGGIRSTTCTIKKFTSSTGIISTISVQNFPSGNANPYYVDIPMQNNDYIFIDVINSFGSDTISISFTASIPDSIRINDYIRPDQFLPALSCLDIIKYLIGRFGCVVYFDLFSKSISINIIDKIKKESALDWSNYYISHRSEYTVDSAMNNYFRMADTDDSFIKKYNLSNSIGFGEGNIMSGNTLTNSVDSFTSPFGASYFNNSKNNSYLSNIGLIGLKDNEGLPYTAVTDAAPGINYNFSDATLLLTVGECVKIVDSNSNLLGYFIVKSIPGAGVITVAADYVAPSTITGKIYRQTVSYNSITPREIIIKPATPLADIGTDSSYHLLDYTFSDSTNTNINCGYFTKSVIGDTIDQFKSNLAFNNPIGFSDPTFIELYFNYISNIYNGPNIRCQMLLPSEVFQSFDFSNFIYLKTEKLTGYFYVKSIVNYQDSNTPVEVNLYML